jgi:predicted permease
MSHNLQVSQTVLAFASVVLLCALVKRRGLIRDDHGPLLAQLLTEVALLVVIFSKLATQPIAPRQFLLVLAMIGAVIVCLAPPGPAPCPERLGALPGLAIRRSME